MPPPVAAYLAGPPGTSHFPIVSWFSSCGSRSLLYKAAAGCRLAAALWHRLGGRRSALPSPRAPPRPSAARHGILPGPAPRAARTARAASSGPSCGRTRGSSGRCSPSRGRETVRASASARSPKGKTDGEAGGRALIPASSTTLSRSRAASAGHPPARSYWQVLSENCTHQAPLAPRAASVMTGADWALT